MPNRNQNSRRGRNNNPDGRNQFTTSWLDSARDRPVAAAAVAAATVGAGVFLWSRRNQISEQLGHLSDQIGEWSDNLGSGSREFETVGADDQFTSSAGTGSKSSTSRTTGMSEIGGGNASLGAQSGGGGLGTTSGKTGRGRA